MNNNNLFFGINKKKFVIHFIGIGGVGMSSIAEYMFLSGYNITGSDIYINERTNYLSSLGIKVYNFHSKNNIINCNLIVYSSAINCLNEEIVFSKIYNIPIISRIEMLYELTKYSYLITVIGTHGKTTVTSMIFDFFFNYGIKINCINGGNIKSINSYIYLSDSKYFLIELDESDNLFNLFKPTIVVLTNIDSDHLNNYNNNINNLINSFLIYIKNIPFYGYLITCLDNNNIKFILKNNFLKCKIITYGFNKDSDFLIKNLIQKKNTCNFDLCINKKKIYNLNINIFGKYNILNVVSCITLFNQFYKINLLDIQKFLYFLKGVSRRSEIIGEFSFSYKNKFYNNILFISDYGHHPTEIKYILKSLKESWNRRIIMIFQPHRFSRTKMLLNYFANVLYKVNILLLLNIYSAFESNNNYNISSNKLFSLMYDLYNYKNCILINNDNEIFEYLLNIIIDNDIIIFQGAGKVNFILSDFISNYINN